MKPHGKDALDRVSAHMYDTDKIPTLLVERHLLLNFPWNWLQFDCRNECFGGVLGNLKYIRCSIIIRTDRKSSTSVKVTLCEKKRKFSCYGNGKFGIHILDQIQNKDFLVNGDLPRPLTNNSCAVFLQDKMVLNTQMLSMSSKNSTSKFLI